MIYVNQQQHSACVTMLCGMMVVVFFLLLPNNADEWALMQSDYFYKRNRIVHSITFNSLSQLCFFSLSRFELDGILCMSGFDVLNSFEWFSNSIVLQ